MARKYISNITIMAEVGDRVSLPSQIIAINENQMQEMVNVTWSPSIVDTSHEGEFIFVGKVVGYAHDVLCAVVVGEIPDNPPSVFPDAIDQFGLPKKDIHTADIPDIDDYQYFKAKAPRTTVEQAQLEQLTEVLADKIILARDINHQRNAIIELEKYTRDLGDRLKVLEEQVRDLTDRVDDIERDMVVDGENLGSGEEVFKRKRRNKLEFRTLRGGGSIDVYESGDEIVIEDGGGGVSMDNCGSGTFAADSFEVCSPDGFVKFSDYFGLRWADTKNMEDPEHNAVINKSVLFVLGVGEGTSDMKWAGRILKGRNAFIMEMKTKSGSGSCYSGLIIDKNGANLYSNEASKINTALVGLDAYSSSVSM